MKTRSVSKGESIKYHQLMIEAERSRLRAAKGRLARAKASVVWSEQAIARHGEALKRLEVADE